MRQHGFGPRCERRPDAFDALLRWMHRLLNPPATATSPARSGRPQRVRDRVPI